MHALFKETEKNMLYSLFKQRDRSLLDNQTYELINVYKINIVQSKSVFRGQFVKRIARQRIEYNGSIAYNKNLTVILFPGQNCLSLVSLNQRLRELVTHRTF